MTYKFIISVTKPTRCRIKPSLFGETVGSFKSGSEVELLSNTSRRWCRVRGHDAKTGRFIAGYCNKKYLSREV